MAVIRERACAHAPEGGVRSWPKSSFLTAIRRAGKPSGDKLPATPVGRRWQNAHSHRKRVLVPIAEEKLTLAIQGTLAASTSVSGLGVVILHCSSTSRAF